MIRLGRNQTRRLGIVNHNEVLLETHALAILLGVKHEHVASLLRQCVFTPCSAL